METLKENRKQIKQYQLIRERDSEIEILATATRKYDIERAFNRYMRLIREIGNSIIDRRGNYWAIVTTYAESCHWDSEFYIRLIKL